MKRSVRSEKKVTEDLSRGIALRVSFWKVNKLDFLDDILIMNRKLMLQSKK